MFDPVPNENKVPESEQAVDHDRLLKDSMDKIARQRAYDIDVKEFPYLGKLTVDEYIEFKTKTYEAMDTFAGNEVLKFAQYLIEQGAIDALVMYDHVTNYGVLKIKEKNELSNKRI